MTKEELKNHIKDIIEDQKDCPLPLEVALDSYVDSLLSKFTEEVDLEYNKPTFYGTVVNSPEWQAWIKENEQQPQFDVHESMETGWLSPGHFQAFLEFVRRHE